MKRIAVCGAFGFLGSHLVTRLKNDGHFVRAIGRSWRWPKAETRKAADEQHEADLTSANYKWLFHQIDEVYQLAGEVGGLGYIENKENDAAILSNSMKINLNVLDACVAKGVKKIFFASSACVYPSLRKEERGSLNPEPCVWHSYNAIKEADAYPAQPTNAFGWEKLFAERLYTAYANKLQVRIGRLHNTYGPLGTWQEPRAKVVAALCRKVALLPAAGGEVEIWGDGTQRRSFTYVDDAVEGMIRLMASDCDKPVNIGSSQMVTIHHLLDAIGGMAGKKVIPVFGPGPVGVHGRNSDNQLCRQVLGWEPVTPLVEGLKPTYEWVAKQVLTTAESAVV